MNLEGRVQSRLTEILKEADTLAAYKALVNRDSSDECQACWSEPEDEFCLYHEGLRDGVYEWRRGRGSKED